MIRTAAERQIGRTIFGSDAAGYAAGRPGYPDALFDLLSERCGLGVGTRVLDVGAGTGQATRVLVERGARVTAVEPDARMAAALAGSIGSSATVLGMSLAEVRLGGFDLGVAASSWGWLDPIREHPQVARLLRPGGWWAMWWNVFQKPEGDRVLDAAMAGATLHAGTIVNDLHYALNAPARLAELAAIGMVDTRYVELANLVGLTPAAFRALVATLSPIRALAGEDRARWLARVEAMAEEEAVDGYVQRRFRVPVFLARKPCTSS